MFALRKPLVLFSLLIVIWAHTDSYHTCVHDQIPFEPEFIDMPHFESPEGRALQDEYQNIRILFEYAGGAFNTTTPEFQDYIINTVLPPVKNIFEKSLKVKPIIGNLTGQRLTRMCSNAITVPTYYNEVGVEADLVLFVDVVNDTAQTYAAFATPCVMSMQNKRPLFGRVVYNAARVNANKNNVTIEKDTSVTLHEVTHALGFTSGLYSYFINPATNQALTGHLITKIVNGQNISLLNVEPLTTRLREYFGCSALEGAYLENEGSSGSKNSHFERRVFYNEYMTASTLQDTRMSQFTLALLEGSGWYKPDYTMAEPMTWGKGKGCIFLDWPCVDSSSKATRFEEFCSPLKKMSCSWTGRGAGVCGTSSMRTNAALSSAVDYWGNKTIVNDAFSDNCPIPDIYSNLDCEDERNQAGSTLPTQEFYGVGGKCFIGTLYPPGRTASPFGYCFKQTCDLQADGSYILKVAVGNQTVVCNASEVSVTGLTGKLYCPDANSFCQRVNSEGFCRKGCSARGSCVNQMCQCEDGWGSHDCSRKVYTDKCTSCSGAGQDPFRSSCYGDSCECNPANTTCMCGLGLKTGSECNVQSTTTPTNTTTTNTTTTTAPRTNTTSTTNTTTTNTTTTNSTTTTAPTNTTTTNSTAPTSTNTTTTNTTTTAPRTNTTTTNTTTTAPTTNTTTTNSTTTTAPTNTTTTNSTAPTSTNTTTTNTTTISTNKTKYESDGGNMESRGGEAENPVTETKNEETSGGNNLALILGLAAGGVVLLSLGIFFGAKYGRHIFKSKKATRQAPIQRANSIANPGLRRQMTANQTKYNYVP